MGVGTRTPLIIVYTSPLHVGSADAVISPGLVSVAVPYNPYTPGYVVGWGGVDGVMIRQVRVV